MISYKIAAIGLLLAATATWIACESSAQDEPEKPDGTVAVRLASVISKTLNFPIHSSGKIASKEEVNLSFKIGGVLQKILADEGASVQKGQTIARLDLTEIRAQVKQAESGFAKARRDLKRVENLYADSVVTLEQLQDARTALDVAESRFNIARFNSQHAIIVTPARGRILRRFAEPGEIIGAGQPVFRFASLDDAWIVRASVTDRDVLTLTLGDSATIHVDAYPNHVFKGVVSEIGESAHPATGTFEIEIQIDIGNYKLVSGFFATVDMFPNQNQRYSILPIESLFESNGTEGVVFVYDAGTKSVEKRSVKIERIMQNSLAVSRGVKEGERVVTDGALNLSAGARVSVVE